MQRYFVRNDQIVDDIVNIIGGDFHHIKNVMRMKLNTQVYVCNDDEEVYICYIQEYLSDSVVLKISEKVNKKVELDAFITIAFGLTKKDKQEEVIRRITELGASGFVNVEMERSVVRITEKDKFKLDRLVNISKEASEQSHRSRLVRIDTTINFKSFLDYSSDFDILLYAYEEAGRDNNCYFKEIIKTFKAKKVLILIGPEGGISLKEVKLLEERDFKAIGLGPRILRCETAPLYIMSAISYELEV